MTLDINVLIEQAARAIVANIDSRPGAWDALSPQAREYWLGESTAALAVIVPAVTAEIRALHSRITTRVYDERDCADGMCEGHHDSISGACWCPSHLLPICRECARTVEDPADLTAYPCPTVRVLDDLDKAARGGDRADH